MKGLNISCGRTFAKVKLLVIAQKMKFSIMDFFSKSD